MIDIMLSKTYIIDGTNSLFFLRNWSQKTKAQLAFMANKSGTSKWDLE